ncbi:MAG: hypothetical protein A2W93_09450 [Bacteroidetes bacterium GWF2_43_63]|nr:MAG: hypothetical protein A2W94_05835 [Bacteroidetes bacterium GWE2_42_42]OFY54520.1 MAG: hypothetical protein A2W93_09450 [Bacteroidetes bacterium GWF2_43_63]HBG70471.1 hypothetical protein [Bacteroidales bacterium]HCB63411.1 hypothetical protein [Bacteroidales bacterium]
MNWIEPKIESIVTSDVIFYSKEYADTCARICTTLGIDIVPDASGETYWQFQNGKWSSNPIDADQKVDIRRNIFDQSVLKSMELSPSNLLFAFDNEKLCGIVHFTNYNVLEVYQALYQNFFNFETALRNHLNTFGFDIQSFRDYFQYQHKKDSKDNYFVEKIKSLNSDKTIKSAEQVGILQVLYLSDLLGFSKSRWLEPEIKSKIGLSGIESEKIAKLRNVIMHAKYFTRESIEEDYNFATFKNFFSLIIAFRNAFNTLNNVSTLRQLEGLDAAQLKSYFYNRI